jgi:O-methyltransferase domain
VHDWQDDAAVKILANCRSAMAPGGRVLLVEIVMPEGSPTPDATRFDVTMLVFTHSRERTEAEYRDLLQRAGLALVGTAATASPFSILEATAD